MVTWPHDRALDGIKKCQSLGDVEDGPMGFPWLIGFPCHGWLVGRLVGWLVYIYIYTLIIRPLPISWDDRGVYFL